jgi:hypothetical protein
MMISKSMAVCAVSLFLSNAIVFAQSYGTSWIGNTNGGAHYDHIPMDVDDIAVTPDGTVYTDCRWDEDRREISILKDGALVNTVDWDAHAGGHSGGGAIAANSKYIYVAQGMANENNDLNHNNLPNCPPAGREWSIVRRYDHTGIQAPFARGNGFAGSMLVINEVPRTKPILVEVTGGATNHIAGLAATDSELFVSDRYLGKIRVYNASSMAPIREWRLDRPGKLAVCSGYLWIVQEGDTSHPPRILKYSREGVLQSATITFGNGVLPAGIAWNPAANRLMVADNGPDQNVKMYDVTKLRGSPTVVADTLGATGGIYSGTKGLVGPLRFNGLSGVGADSVGNIYVAQNGQGPMLDNPATGYDVGSGTVIESYSQKKKRLWAVYGLQFVDCADVDPASETDVFTGDKHYTMDYGKPDGQEWTYKSYTIDRFRYPQDARLNNGNVNRTGGVSIRYILGHKFMFLTDMNGESIAIYRFKGQIAVPSGMWARASLNRVWQPNQPVGEWIWRDSNGNGKFDPGEYSQNPGGGDAPEMFGRYIDSKGSIWMCGGSTLRKFPAGRTLDAYGNPQYSFATMETFTLPSNMKRLERVEYNAADDVMYLGGYFSTVADTWGVFKRVERISKWSTGNRTPDWVVSPDYKYTHNNQTNMFPKAMSVAGDYLFVAYFSPANKHVSIYRTADGTYCGTLSPGDSIGKVTGDVDIPQGIRAYKRANGEYLIFQEDDARAKVVMYRWTPAGDRTVTSINRHPSNATAAGTIPKVSEEP